MSTVPEFVSSEINIAAFVGRLRMRLCFVFGGTGIGLARYCVRQFVGGRRALRALSVDSRISRVRQQPEASCQNLYRSANVRKSSEVCFRIWLDPARVQLMELTPHVSKTRTIPLSNSQTASP